MGFNETCQAQNAIYDPWAVINKKLWGIFKRTMQIHDVRLFIWKIKKLTWLWVQFSRVRIVDEFFTCWAFPSNHSRCKVLFKSSPSIISSQANENDWIEGMDTETFGSFSLNSQNCESSWKIFLFWRKLLLFIPIAKKFIILWKLFWKYSRIWRWNGEIKRVHQNNNL